MIAVSDAWKDIQQRFLLPEGFIEISCAITEEGLQERAVASSTNEAAFSNISKILDTSDVSRGAKYATNEHNFWILDGSRTVLPDTGPYNGVGYASNIEATGSVTVILPEVHTVPIPGVTITWSDEYGEYPSVFTITAKNGETVVAELTVTDNTTRESVVDMELSNYDSVTITVHNWCLPHRRARIEKIALGHILVLTKGDIMSYTHEQYGDLLTGELPKNRIEFSLDNTDGRWNPNNPTGMEKYLAERQKLTVRYGLDVNGTIEWIKAGTFYLSEWRTPANGLEATFAARDIFEFLLSPHFEGESVHGNLSHIITSATRAFLPEGASVKYGVEMTGSESRTATSGTAAEWVQKCANAGCCIIRYDREGVLHIEPLNSNHSGYLIPLSLSYSHPEISLSKPLKEVSAEYNDGTNTGAYKLIVGNTGETQTITNDFLKTQSQASVVAAWVSNVLQNRKVVSGEFRADPRLDLFDIVTVESKYGELTPVCITDIKYTFNGAFHGKYTGRVLEATKAVLGTFVLGKDTLG